MVAQSSVSRKVAGAIDTVHWVTSKFPYFIYPLEDVQISRELFSSANKFKLAEAMHKTGFVCQCENFLLIFVGFRNGFSVDIRICDLRHENNLVIIDCCYAYYVTLFWSGLL